MNYTSFLTIESVNINCCEKSLFSPERSNIQVDQHLWRSGGAHGVSTTLPGVLVGHGTGLREARGFEEEPAQFKLLWWQGPAETTPQRLNGVKQSPLPPCLAIAQAKEGTALL